MLCGYDFTVAVRSKKKSGNRRNQDKYEIAVKVAFDEDPSVLTVNETEEINRSWKQGLGMQGCKTWGYTFRQGLEKLQWIQPNHLF